MERTAQYARMRGGQAEILLRVKQAENPSFAFFHPDHTLNAYYEYLKKTGFTHPVPIPTAVKPSAETVGSVLAPPGMKARADVAAADAKEAVAKPVASIGLVHYSSDDDEDDGKAASTGTGVTANVVASVPSVSTVVLPSAPKEVPAEEMIAVIQKLAPRVCSYGMAFENIIKAKEVNNPLFAFLNPWNPFHAYYQWVLQCQRVQQDQNTVGTRTSRLFSALD